MKVITFGVSTVETGARLSKSSVYSEIEPSLKLTVYMLGDWYVGMPITVAWDGGECV